MLLVWAVMIAALMLVLVPLKIRASRTQDFASSFDLGFVKRFLALTWPRIELWKNLRRGYEREFEAEMMRVERKTTSKAGNALAWILLVPFVLLFIVMIVWFASHLP